MIIKETGIEGKQITLEELDFEMKKLGFHRWSWDYKRGTYDYKFIDNKLGEVFYLRVPVVAIKGELEENGNDSIVEIHEPYLARWMHPHGLDFDFPFPEQLLETAKQRLHSLFSELKNYSAEPVE